MRIVSNFRDYYDSAAGLGVDMTQVYVRKTAPVRVVYQNVPHNSSILCREESYHQARVYGSCNPVIFCGKVYRAVAAIAEWKTDRQTIDGRFVWDSKVLSGETLNDAMRHAREFLGVKVEDVIKPKYSSVESLYGRREMERKDKLLWETLEKVDWDAEHRAVRSPVFVIRGMSVEESKQFDLHGFRYGEHPYLLESNPQLHQYGFFRIKDAYTAFQEISMYLGGVMGSEGNPMVKLNDKELLQKHGFDNWSFKKMPEKRK